MAVEECAWAKLFEHFEGVDVGEAVHDAFRGATGEEERAMCGEDGVHAGGEEVDVFDGEAGHIAGLIGSISRRVFAEVDVCGERTSNALSNGKLGLGCELGAQISTESCLDEFGRSGNVFAIGSRRSLGRSSMIVGVASQIYGRVLLVSSRTLTEAWKWLRLGSLVDEIPFVERSLAELGPSAGNALPGVLPKSFCCWP